MTDAVEIYICKTGQKIEEGQMVMSNDIDCKEAAEEDAKKRCKIVPSTAKIVYYDVSGGGFKVLYSYTNPNVVESKKQVRYGGGGGTAPVKRKKPKKPKTFMEKLKKGLGI